MTDSIRKRLDEINARIANDEDMCEFEANAAVVFLCALIERLETELKDATTECDDYRVAAGAWMKNYDDMVEKYEPKVLVHE